MTNLTEVSAWDAGVYQFFTTDPVQGGPGGIDNEPHQNLVDRTLWLRNRIAAAIIQSGQADGSTDNQQLVEAIVLQVASVPALRLVPVPLVPTTQTVLVLTRGQNSDSDGFAATYKWAYSSSAVDDGKSVITPSTAPGSGRWLVCGINASALGGQPAAFYATTLNVAAAVAPLAPLASPPFSGTPTTPTPAATDSSTALPNTGWVASNFVAHTGTALAWNSNPNTYFKLATLPASSLSTADSINVKATLNVGYAAGSDTMLEGIFGNRGGFSYVYNVFGPNNPATCIVCFAETDGTTSVYALCTTTFGFATVTILNSGVAGITGPAATLYPAPAATLSPTGTLIFSSAAPLTYPPFLNVSSPLSYLTPSVAAATYLPVAGGTLTGQLNIAGADLRVYRAGGASAAIYLNAAASAYLFLDGTNFYLQAPGSPVLFVNGAVVATVTQVTAAQGAAIASSNATTAAALTNYLPKAGGTMTGPLVVASNVTLAGGDLFVYRAGGTTGVMFLNAAQNAYVYWNGSSYNMPNGEVIANGFQLARLVSPGFSGTPTAPTPAITDNSNTLATTAFAQAVAAGTSGSNANGFWMKLPNGYILQFGYNSVAGGTTVTQTYPTPFLVACGSIMLTPSGVNATLHTSLPSASNSSFQLTNGAGGAGTSWMAMGR